MTNGRPAWMVRRPRPRDACPLCGVRFDNNVRHTRDHVVPDAGYGNDKPANVLTWRVCGPCQSDLSPREDRLFALFSRAHSRHEELVVDQVSRGGRSTRQPWPILRKFVTTDSGQLVPANIAAPRSDDLDAVFRKITRGLHWFEHHTLPPHDRQIARIVAPHAFAQLTRDLNQRIERLGAGCWWMRAYDQNDLSFGLWLFLVFGAIPVVVAQGRAADLPLPDAVGVALRED